MVCSRVLFCLLTVVVGSAGVAGDTSGRVQGVGTPPLTTLTLELKAQILEVMRLNRQTFQDDAVLKRYGEARTAATHTALVACGLPRTPAGAPAAYYSAPQAHSTPRPYTEDKVVDCLGTTGGLSGTRAAPLAQHYYCSLPGLSPDIRGCFTFQLRLPRVSRTRSVWEEGFLPDGTPLPLEKGWNFLGPDTNTVPDVKQAFGYCAKDGRPHWINTLKNKKRVPLEVASVHPTPTRPMCWVAETQAEIFQGIMGGTINLSIQDQMALLREYYDCPGIKGKVNAGRYKALCG
jgi:hypothetical protein